MNKLKIIGLITSLSILSLLTFKAYSFLSVDKQDVEQDVEQDVVNNNVQQDNGGFSFDCDNTSNNPCRTLVASNQGKNIKIEPSGIVWSDSYKKAIIVSDNYNDLLSENAAHYAISSFSLKAKSSKIAVKPLLTPKQAKDYPLYDLEGITLIGNKIYAISSSALHGKNPQRDRWERHQFIQMDLTNSKGTLQAKKLSHVLPNWPDFRNWLISKSGYSWTGEETRDKAEADGINVEALSANSSGNLVIGFRSPLLSEENVLALEFSLPSSSKEELSLVKKHSLPQVKATNVPQGAPKGLRGMAEVPDKPGEYYVLVGPKGYEKERIVLARWNSKTRQLSKVTPLPDKIVGEGVIPVTKNKLLIVDDLNQAILVATEN